MSECPLAGPHLRQVMQANGTTPPDRIDARAEGDIERTRESDGKASAAHFFHFDFTPGQVQRGRTGEGSAMLVIDHSNYGHAALIGPETRGFLARECFA